MIEEFSALVPDSLRAQSGSVFYSGRSAFNAPSALYVLGLNPGGSPDRQSKETVAWHTKSILNTKPSDWSEYQDERWRGREPGTYGLQPRILHLLHRLGLNPRRVPSSNVVFVRSERDSDIKDRFRELAEACWPFHEYVIKRLEVRVILCFGQRAGTWVCKQLNASEKIDEFVEVNNRRWKSPAFINRMGVAVIVATHPSIADWTASSTDPTPLVQRVMVRQCINEANPKKAN